jgi:transposase
MYFLRYGIDIFQIRIFNGNMHGITITEIAKKLGITYLTAKQRLLRAGIKPITKEAIYPESALEAIRDVPGKGRPKKAAPEPVKEKPKGRKAK